MFQSSLGHTINESQMKHLLKTCTVILNTDSTIRHAMQTMHASAIRPIKRSPLSRGKQAPRSRLPHRAAAHRTCERGRTRQSAAVPPTPSPWQRAPASQGHEEPKSLAESEVPHKLRVRRQVGLLVNLSVEVLCGPSSASRSGHVY